MIVRPPGCTALSIVFPEEVDAGGLVLSKGIVGIPLFSIRVADPLLAVNSLLRLKIVILLA